MTSHSMDSLQVNRLYTYIDILNPDFYKGSVKYRPYKPVIVNSKMNLSPSRLIISNENLDRFNLSESFDVERMVLKQKGIILKRMRANKILNKVNNNYRYPIISFFITSIFYLALGGIIVNLILL